MDNQGFDVHTATGYFLDVYGLEHGIKRGGRSDDDFRKEIISELTRRNQLVNAMLGD